MDSMSREARSVSLTRYGMAPAEGLEGFACRTYTALLYILQALANSLAHVNLRGDIEKALISLGVLHHGLRLSIDGKDHGFLGLLQNLHEFCRIPAEGCNRLNVFLDV